MTKEKTDSIIDKIKKLMALGGSSNEHEASLAMQRVQEILASYNLTMAEVESHKGKDAGNGDVNANRKKDTLEKSAMYNYQRLLMKRVADVHYCLHFVYEKRTWNSKTNRDKVLKYHVLIGREANVVTAKLMFDYLNSTIEKLAKEVYPYPANLSRSAISWKEGCSSRLQERLRERKLEADRAQEEKAAEYRKTHTNGTSLMLLTDIRQAEEDLNHDFLYGDDAGTGQQEEQSGKQTGQQLGKQRRTSLQCLRKRRQRRKSRKKSVNGRSGRRSKNARADGTGLARTLMHTTVAVRRVKALA